LQKTNKLKIDCLTWNRMTVLCHWYIDAYVCTYGQNYQRENRTRYFIYLYRWHNWRCTRVYVHHLDLQHCIQHMAVPSVLICTHTYIPTLIFSCSTNVVHIFYVYTYILSQNCTYTRVCRTCICKSLRLVFNFGPRGKTYPPKLKLALRGEAGPKRWRFSVHHSVLRNSLQMVMLLFVKFVIFEKMVVLPFV
jgi:hypothetical protein